MLEHTPQADQLVARVHQLFEQYNKLQQSLNQENANSLRTDEPAKLADVIAANLQLSIEEEAAAPRSLRPPKCALARIATYTLDIAIEKLNMDRTIQSRVKRQMERAQKEYYLNEKIKAIQKELGRGEKSEFDEAEERRSRKPA